MYFDMPIEPDPEERGLYWATRTTPVKKVFSYRPDEVYENLDVDVFGNALNRTALCNQLGCPTLNQPNNIVGK
jgi:hexosaminidase